MKKLVKIFWNIVEKCCNMLSSNPNEFHKKSFDTVDKLFKFISWCIATAGMAVLAKITGDIYAFFGVFLMSMAIIAVISNYSIVFARRASLVFLGHQRQFVKPLGLLIFFIVSFSLAYSGNIFVEKIVKAFIGLNAQKNFHNEPK